MSETLKVKGTWYFKVFINGKPVRMV